MTERQFNNMLNEYLTEEMLKEETIRRDYILQHMDHDDSWKGGTHPVPWRAAQASSVSFGELTATNDVADSTFLRGSIADYREVWGTLQFRQRDIMEHDGRINEDSFLDLLPDEVEHFVDYKKQVVSCQMGSGPHFAAASGDGGADGTMVVDKVDRFNIGQKVTLDDDNSAAQTLYVTAIDVNTDDVTFSDTRGGSAFDISAYTTAQNAKFYHPGVFDASGNHDTFISMRQAFLSSANGGDATIHGQTKASYPILQAYNEDGSSWDSSNFLEKLFDGMTNARKRGKGQWRELLMDLKNYGTILKLIELSKGAYRVVEEEKAALYGWFEITIANVTGQRIKMVGIQEWDSDIIVGIDWNSVQFVTNGFFRKRVSPDGRQYYETRGTTGFVYLIDCCLFGEIKYRKPGHNFIVHSISY